MRSTRVFVLVILALLTWGLRPSLSFAADEPKEKEFATLKYRLVGPFAGGRVSRACGVPGDPLTYYAATASGGVWKSSDGGHTWKPVFDDQPTSSIGSIAVAASDPNVVYVGTGEANIRGNGAPGAQVRETAFNCTLAAAKRGEAGVKEDLLLRLKRGYRILLTRAIKGFGVRF